MLDGNTQFHVDPRAKPIPVGEVIEAQADDENPFGWVVF